LAWVRWRSGSATGCSIQDPIGGGGKGDETSASAEGGGFKVTLTNFWPGAYFALFGTVIIGIMLWQGSPELIMKELTDANKGSKGTGVVRTTELRGSGSDTDIDQQWDKLSEPGLTMPAAAEPLSNIARIWREQGRTGEALAMARLSAVLGERDKAAHLDLFAGLLEETGDGEKALKAMQAAADEDPAYRDALARLRQRLDESSN
jgi:hypothetical protein